MIGKFTWYGASGNPYDFEVYPRAGGTWNNIGGVYVFASLLNGSWRADYVGKTNNFAERFSRHERMLEAILCGTTHIHARVIGDEVSRGRAESDLILALRPPLNERVA